MNRRNFLQTAAAGALSQTVLRADAPTPWRTFEITTRVEVLNPNGPTRIWLPAPLAAPSPFQKTLSNQFQAPTGKARLITAHTGALAIVAAEFPAGAKPVLTLSSRVSTRNFAVDLAAPTAPKPNRAELDYFLRPSKLIPTDGIVKATAADITRGAVTDLDKARAIYSWIVDNTFRNPKTLGCGVGDIRFMLESKDLGGKCADLNALYVGLARAAGLPARDVYGIRIAPSNLGYKSLGASSSNITKSQHCRAEVYISTHGWLPVDPADVRKVVLEEPPGNRPLDDRMVTDARARLFGSWEMNWMAYNFGHDVALPGSSGASLGFFMYPQAETGGARVDSLNPDRFQYQITATEI